MTTAKQLQTTTARLALKAQGKPYFAPTTTPGLAVGYRRLEGRAGTWVLRKADGNGSNWTAVIGTADDLEKANGTDVLTYAQAVDKARERIRGQPTGGKPVTVLEAIDAYEKDLEQRGRSPKNAKRLRTLVPDWLGAKAVAALTAAELKRFRDAAGLEPANLNRTLRPLKAALSLAASMSDGTIPNTLAWKNGLKAIPGTERPRDGKPLTTKQVLAIVDAAYRLDPAFGLFVAIGAETGARPSQIAAIRVCDLQTDRLMIPSSRKGNEGKQARLNAVPITTALAARLRLVAASRGEREPLLARDGWGRDYYMVEFRKVAKELGLPKGTTFYALRHAAVVRQIFAGVPLRLIAARLDTSAAVIEKNYSAQINDADDAMMRRGLLEDASNVLPLQRSA